MAGPVAFFSIAFLSKTHTGPFPLLPLSRGNQVIPNKWIPIFIGVFSTGDARILTPVIPLSSHVPVPVHPTDCSSLALPKLVIGWCQVKVGQLTWSPSLVSLLATGGLWFYFIAMRELY